MRCTGARREGEGETGGTKSEALGEKKRRASAGAEGRQGFDTAVVKVSAADRSGEMKAGRSYYILVVVIERGGREGLVLFQM